MIRYCALTLTLASTLTAPCAIAQWCNPNIRETTPSERFVIDIKQSTVLDTKTGLMWKRTLDYNFNWGQALRRAAASSHAGYKDWRIPNIKELESLVEEKCQDPAINTTVFPNAPSYFVWASSPYPGRADEALTIDLRDGASREETRDNNYVVWLVRGGP